VCQISPISANLKRSRILAIRHLKTIPWLSIREINTTFKLY
jgi:hypothetical protein